MYFFLVVPSYLINLAPTSFRIRFTRILPRFLSIKYFLVTHNHRNLFQESHNTNQQQPQHTQVLYPNSNKAVTHQTSVPLQHSQLPAIAHMLLSLAKIERLFSPKYMPMSYHGCYPGLFHRLFQQYIVFSNDILLPTIQKRIHHNSNIT